MTIRLGDHAIRMETIILASGSLRRQDYLRLLGLPFSIMPSRASEEPSPGLDPRAQAEAIARRKVDEVVKTLEGRLPPWILGADTLIIVDGQVYGKPKDKEDARKMLRTLSGREHEVVTALALYNGRTKSIDSRSNLSFVRFADLSEAEVDWYLETGEWQGVAGSYRIQGLASCFISEIRGSYSSIVGLPMHEFYVMLRENGYSYSGT
jgi:septum formation protein